MSSKDPRERSSAASAIIIGVLIAVIPAALGYIGSYLDGIRKDMLALTNDQIQKLYGPLHALAQTNEATWKAFVDSGRAPDWNNLSKEQVALWRVWMQNILQPVNIRTEKTIVDNSQLVIGDEFPVVFRKVIAHTEAYNALIATWNKDDLADLKTYTSKSSNTVDLVYPDNFDRCVGPIYAALNKRQEALQKFIFQSFSLVPVPIPPECNE